MIRCKFVSLDTVIFLTRTSRLVQFIQQGQIEITEAVSNMTQSVDKLHFKANGELLISSVYVLY